MKSGVRAPPGPLRVRNILTLFFLYIQLALKINIVDNAFLAIVEIDTKHEYESEKKSFFFEIKKEMEFETMLPIGYEFLKTIIIDKPMIVSNGLPSTGYEGHISVNIINEKKIYRIFVLEIKTRAENRDSKLDNLLEESI